MQNLTSLFSFISFYRKLEVISNDAKLGLSSILYQDGPVGVEQRFRVYPEFSMTLGLLQTMNVATAAVLQSSMKTVIAKCTDDLEIQDRVICI